MIPKLIRLGVVAILKVLCEKIIIRNILILNKNDKFNGKIDEVYIKAESIIFNKINISNVNINIKDIVLKFPFNAKKIFIDNCYAVINMRLTRDNINKTLFSDKWKRLKDSIELFISMNFQSIEFYNKSIYFIPSDNRSNKNIDYTLQYDKNRILLVNNIDQTKLPILNDKNIIIKSLFLCENYIELELNSKVMFN
tara:strand:+ start:187 stop:774 length:588 start_codon:yes stop_codon:yes gene_type:complete